MPSEIDKEGLQIVVPIAGRSLFFSAEQFFFPKPLIEVGGTMMIERVIKNLASIHPGATFTFIVRHEDVVKFSLDRTLSLLTGGRCKIVELRAEAKGALCSILMAIDEIDADRPVIVSNADQIIDGDLASIVDEFRTSGVDAGVVTFESVHPRWSYVNVDDQSHVLEAAEKRVISRNAIAGFYYFASGETLMKAAKISVSNDASIDGQFYIAPALNEIVLDGGRVTAHRIATEFYHSFYSPEKIRTYEDDVLKNIVSKASAVRSSEVRVLIPAAGEGSRFKTAGFAKPKPFIEVLGRPMVEHVIDNVTLPSSRIHILVRKEHLTNSGAEVDRLKAAGHTIHSVDKLTEGTACTILLARKAFDDDQPLLIANSDQYVDFSVEDFVADCIDRNLDGSILVFRDPKMNAKWSFARVDGAGLVREVAEKKPISDLATVGIYLFRRGSDFVRGAVDMIAQNDRVNNEFYTCPVYNYLIAAGLNIGVYEVPQSAMHGLGTPDDLAQFIDARG